MLLSWAGDCFKLWTQRHFLRRKTVLGTEFLGDSERAGWMSSLCQTCPHAEYSDQKASMWQRWDIVLYLPYPVFSHDSTPPLSPSNPYLGCPLIPLVDNRCSRPQGAYPLTLLPSFPSLSEAWTRLLTQPFLPHPAPSRSITVSASKSWGTATTAFPDFRSPARTMPTAV